MILLFDGVLQVPGHALKDAVSGAAAVQQLLRRARLDGLRQGPQPEPAARRAPPEEGRPLPRPLWDFPRALMIAADCGTGAVTDPGCFS